MSSSDTRDTRYLIEIRSSLGRTVASSVETGADNAYTALLEYLNITGYPLRPSDDHGSPADAVYAVGEPGSSPEVWEGHNLATVVLQSVR